jgi:hypothetical protein
VGSRGIAIDIHSTGIFTTLFQLVIAAAFGLEGDASATAIVAFPSRSIERSVRICRQNVGVPVKAITDLDSLVTQLQKSLTRENAKVRVCVCSHLVALLAGDRKCLDGRSTGERLCGRSSKKWWRTKSRSARGGFRVVVEETAFSLKG